MMAQPLSPRPRSRASFRQIFDRVSRSIAVAAANGVTLYGVLALGWDKSAMVLLFIVEGLIVLVADAVRKAMAKLRREQAQAFFFEAVFMLFFGAFALLVFGPYEDLTTAVEDGFSLFGGLFREIRVAVLFVLASHAWRLFQDLRAAGVIGRRPQRPLELRAGPYALLIFGAVMLAPLIARSGPNPMGGLAALVGLKTAGELLAVWMSGPESRRRNESLNKSGGNP
jgi:hypothetical protein